MILHGWCSHTPKCISNMVPKRRYRVTFTFSLERNVDFENYASDRFDVHFKAVGPPCTSAINFGREYWISAEKNRFLELFFCVRPIKTSYRPIERGSRSSLRLKFRGRARFLELQFSFRGMRRFEVCKLQMNRATKVTRFGNFK